MLRPDLDSGEELKLIEDIELADGEGITVLPGVKELIASLPKDRWTVVTSATEHLARMRLEVGIGGAGSPGDGRDVNEGKPHPAPYLAGAALLGFAPEECVVFEDSASGVAAGCAAGCIVVATHLLPRSRTPGVRQLPGAGSDRRLGFSSAGRRRTGAAVHAAGKIIPIDCGTRASAGPLPFIG